jgi:DNA-binding Lrp family transcriptional regulator
MSTLDPIDQKLLAALRENAREPVATLARKVELSRTAVQARLGRLERDKIITGYTLKSGGNFERSLVQAHIMLKVGHKLSASVEASIRRISEVRSLLSVSGSFDLIAIVFAESIERLDSLIDRIGNIDGVERTHTSVVLSIRLQRGPG